jgi:hypothetical protein
MITKHLNQIDLARRWNISHRTLERWRWRREGPRYLKLGGRIVYRLEDILAYEIAHMSRISLGFAGDVGAGRQPHLVRG